MSSVSKWFGHSSLWHGLTFASSFIYNAAMPNRVALPQILSKVKLLSNSVLSSIESCAESRLNPTLKCKCTSEDCYRMTFHSSVDLLQQVISDAFQFENIKMHKIEIMRRHLWTAHGTFINEKSFVDDVLVHIWFSKKKLSLMNFFF